MEKTYLKPDEARAALKRAYEQTLADIENGAEISVESITYQKGLADKPHQRTHTIDVILKQPAAS